MEKKKIDFANLERQLKEMDDDTLLRSVDELVRHARRMVWRHRMQIRTSIFAATIRTIECAIGERFVRREREPRRCWLFFGKADNGHVVPVVRLDGGSPRTLDDLGRPFEIELLNPALVDLGYLNSRRPLTPAKNRKDHAAP